MFSHIMLGSNDMAASRAFYDATIGALGGTPGRDDPSGRVFYMHGGGLLILTKPIDGEPACHANGGTIGFKADSPEAADAWHAPVWRLAARLAKILPASAKARSASCTSPISAIPPATNCARCIACLPDTAIRAPVLLDAARTPCCQPARRDPKRGGPTGRKRP